MALDSPNGMYETDEGRDREITLSTSTILGIFFALALILALVFGFGYTVGRKSMPTVVTDNPAGADAYKPAAGSPAIQAIPGYLSSKDAAAANEAAPTSQVYAPPPAANATTAGKPTAAAPMAAATQSAAATPTPQTQPAKPAAETVTILPPAPAPAPLPAAPVAVSPSIVQIAAVSHQEDADLLLSALRGRGYNVYVRQEQDKLLHVQIGPFSNRKEADAMRQRLLADGYNAIVK